MLKKERQSIRRCYITAEEERVKIHAGGRNSRFGGGWGSWNRIDLLVMMD